METNLAAETFLAHRRIAVTGVSRTPKNHGANVVYKRLRDRGYEAFAINPNASEVEGDNCFPTLRSVPGSVEAVVIGTSPHRVVDTVRECIELGIEYLWMHQGLGGGSVSVEAAALARQNGLLVIDGGCPCMFGATADPFHRLVKTLKRAGGSLPRNVEDQRTAEIT